ncbi:MAG: sulfite exporter TauE/SafE family protein [Psychrobacter sp.]|nr:sulfite exporter TauE/SafE family protein [Psychrobacter sp.]
MSIALITAALLMGFLGSPHCLGMCGGLVTAFGLSMQGISPGKRRLLIATYHLGRLTSYALLGVIAGLLGTTLLAPFMTSNHLPRILLGLVLVFVGVTMLGAPFLNKLERLGMQFWQKLAPLRKKVFPLTTYPRALMAGLLWGFLPCGLVYGALMMAVVGHSIPTGAMLMFAFGLGTIPMLVATHETVAWLRNHIGRLRLRQVNGIVMMLSGLAVIAVPIMMNSMHGGHGGHAGHAMGADMQSMPMEHIALDQNNPHSVMDHSTMDHSMNHNMEHSTMDHNNEAHNGEVHGEMNHNPSSATTTGEAAEPMHHH